MQPVLSSVPIICCGREVLQRKTVRMGRREGHGHMEKGKGQDRVMAIRERENIHRGVLYTEQKFY